MAEPTQAQWAAALLKRLGIHQTPGAVQALTGWANAEGGHWHNDAKYNPLNTTQPASGAGNTGTQGNIKVYKNWDQGLQATVETLRNGRYGGILKALQSGNPTAVANAIGQTPWGTGGGLVQKTIASTPRVAGVQAFGAGSGGSGGSSQPSQPSRTMARAATQTTGGVDNRAARGAAIASFLGDKGSDPLSFAMQIRGLQDVPGQKVATTKTPSSSPAVGSSKSAFDAVKLDPGANRPGADLTPGIKHVAGLLAARIGHPVEVGTGTNHNQMTTSGNVSDHWSGNGIDVPAEGERLTRLGYNALRSFGVGESEARKMAQTGGLFNLPYGKGRRIQVIFKTNEGGNHYNHLHVGVSPNK